MGGASPISFFDLINFGFLFNKYVRWNSSCLETASKNFFSSSVIN